MHEITATYCFYNVYQLMIRLAHGLEELHPNSYRTALTHEMWVTCLSKLGSGQDFDLVITEN